MFANSTVAPTTINSNYTATASPTATTVISSWSGAYPTAYPACITFVNGSAVAVPINASTPYSSGYPTIYINSTALGPIPTGSSDFNVTTFSASPTGTGSSFVVLTTAAPAVPSSRPFAPRQIASSPVSDNLSSTASPTLSNSSQTVTVVLPSGFGGTNASITFTTAVVAYPTAYPGPYPSTLPLCSDLGGNANSTLASNNSLPGPTSATNNSLTQQSSDHSGAPRLAMSLSVALLSVGTVFAALLL